VLPVQPLGQAEQQLHSVTFHTALKKSSISMPIDNNEIIMQLVRKDLLVLSVLPALLPENSE
jgi:hypothetical protein